MTHDYEKPICEEIWVESTDLLCLSSGSSIDRLKHEELDSDDYENLY